MKTFSIGSTPNIRYCQALSYDGEASVLTNSLTGSGLIEVSYDLSLFELEGISSYNYEDIMEIFVGCQGQCLEGKYQRNMFRVTNPKNNTHVGVGGIW